MNTTKRIISIDILRGFALLGILLMNIMSFAMPDIAYNNPTAFGGEGINRIVYSFTHIIADQKFMALFSMLFGASVILLINKLTEKGQNVGRIHYTRNIWLLVIGLIHATFIWSGDVLTVYALCSFLLYFFRNAQPKWQFTLGLIIFALPSLVNVGIHFIYPELDAGSQWSIKYYWNARQDYLIDDIEFYQGDYWSQVLYRWDGEFGAEGTMGDLLLGISYYFDYFARALAMMLIGMALFTWGILTGQRDAPFYRRMLRIGFGVGYPIALFGLLLNEGNSWSVPYSVFIGRIPNNIATPLIAAGYIALIMLWSRTEVWRGLQDRLASIGRTALTNYILQSLIATTLFYGFGFGLYGQLNRLAQFLIVLAIWLVQLILSPIWMHHFRFGPLEWIWRVLTYQQSQPIRRIHHFSTRE